VPEDGDRPFRAKRETNESEIGKRLRRVNPADATALFELCPTALLFGMWDSTGPKGGLGVKFERALVAEMVGVNAVRGVKTSSRIDPLGIQLKAGPIYIATDDAPNDWTLEQDLATKRNNKPVKMGKDGRPSEANHGNVTPSLSDTDKKTGEFLAGGVTIEFADQVIVISLPVLRRLRFPLPGEAWKPTPEQHARDRAARTVLVALGLVAAALADEAGAALRSRCHLWPEGDKPSWELLDRKGLKRFGVDAESAIGVFNEAVEAAKATGLPWRDTPLRLEPTEDLVKLVRKSQELAVAEGADGEGE
jgi:CRISPR-associated protein Csb1